MPYFYLCPYCASKINQTIEKCPQCNSYITPLRSQFEMKHYYDESIRLYGDGSKWETLLIDEIKENPLFNEDKYKKAIYDKELKKSLKVLNSQKQQNIPKCPTCGSTQIEKIGGLNRAAHAYAFGLFSKTARSQFHCRNCGYKW